MRLNPSICICTFTRSVGEEKNCPTTPAVMPPIIAFLKCDWADFFLFSYFFYFKNYFLKIKLYFFPFLFQHFMNLQFLYVCIFNNSHLLNRKRAVGVFMQYILAQILVHAHSNASVDCKNTCLYQKYTIFGNYKKFTNFLSK